MIAGESQLVVESGSLASKMAVVVRTDLASSVHGVSLLVRPVMDSALKTSPAIASNLES